MDFNSFCSLVAETIDPDLIFSKRKFIFGDSFYYQAEALGGWMFINFYPDKESFLVQVGAGCAEGENLIETYELAQKRNGDNFRSYASKPKQVN